MAASSSVDNVTIDRAKIIGKGNFGIVFEGAWRDLKVAVKRITIQYATSSEREEIALKQFDHENVVKLFHVQEDLDFRIFVLELCDASLDRLFLKENDPKKYRGPMPPETEVLLQLAKGLEHIHQKELVHRDIKPSNVLIRLDSTTQQVKMKWANFGFSKKVNERGSFSMSGVRGTYDWFAPEILTFLNEEGSTESEAQNRGAVKSDVFAEGLVFGYFISGGVHPFGSSSYKISVNVRTNEPVNLPIFREEMGNVCNIITEMLEKEPRNRITSSDVVKRLMQITISTSVRHNSFVSKLKIDRAKILGEGGFGIVFEGVWGEIKVAIKRIPVEKAASSKREENALKIFNDEHVIKLFHVEEDKNFKYFALELCDASLDHLFLKENDPKKYRGPMPPQTEVLLQLAKGLEYIHQMKYVHRDIKPQNVLISLDSTTQRVVTKWADFGFSKQVSERGTYTMKSGVKGTEDYFAPEILKLLDEDQIANDNEAKKRGTVKSDVFAEGLVFGYFLSGVHPFGKTSHQIQNNLRTNEPTNLPKKKEFRNIIIKMLNKKPDNRISSSDAVNLLLNFMQTTVKKESGQMSISGSSAFSSFANRLTIDRAKILGKGKYGIVFEGAWGEIKVAVKRIPLENVAIISNEQEEMALKMLDHTNVIKLFQVQEDQDFKIFVLELCDASLDKLFLKENDQRKYSGPMPPDTEVLLQLAKGLEYIHQMKYVHRDIKPQNVLISLNSTTQQVKMKWADFGFSKRVNERGTFTMSGVNGTLNWLAPEILKLLDEDSSTGKEVQKIGTVKSDVFAEGLVFGYFLSRGIHPFGSSNYQIQINLRTNEPANLPQTKEIRNIIEKMLEKEPINRITSSDVLNLLIIKIPKIRMKKMFTLIAKGNPSKEEIGKLIQEGVDINAKDKKGLAPLLHLAENKNKSDNVVEIVRLLIQYGANVNTTDWKGRNALHLLCENHRNHQDESFVAMVNLWIEKGIEVNCKNKYGENALTKLCEHNEGNLVEKIQLLIEKKIDVNCKTKDGLNALTLLCKFYYNENLTEVIQLLIQHGIDVNRKTNDGSNALTLLWDKKNLKEIMDLLIQRGFNVTSETCTFFQNNYHKENRDEILKLLDQQLPNEPVSKRRKFE